MMISVPIPMYMSALLPERTPRHSPAQRVSLAPTGCHTVRRTGA
jgi:hypothetical protein